MSEEQRIARQGFERAAKQQRLSEARELLVGEHAAFQYLMEKNREGAARIVARNIQNMTQRISRFEQELR